jgi:hypothetical protein
MQPASDGQGSAISSLYVSIKTGGRSGVMGAAAGALFTAVLLLLEGWSESFWLACLAVAYGALVGAIFALIAGPVGGNVRRAVIGASVMVSLTL